MSKVYLIIAITVSGWGVAALLAFGDVQYYFAEQREDIAQDLALNTALTELQGCQAATYVCLQKAESLMIMNRTYELNNRSCRDALEWRSN